MGVSGGVPKPVDEIDGVLALVAECVETVGCAKVEVGDGADKAGGGTVEIFGVEDAKPESVATDEDELDRVGLLPRADGVGKDGFDMIDGDGRE